MRAVAAEALVGRDREVALIERLLLDAREGHSGALAIVGEAGQGKTALLEHAGALARDMGRLCARGLETETDFAFSGLHDLLRPVLGLISGLPAPQASALEGALAIGPPSARDRFAISAATLGLLGLAAEEGRLLVTVEDLQWLDRPSAEAILFAARRLADEGVAVLIAARPEVARSGLLAGISAVDLSGLDPAAARELLAGVGIPLAATVADAVVAATEGNPLALIEGARLLTEAQRLGHEPLDGPLPVGAAIAARFHTASEPLDDAGRTALLVAATGGEGLPIGVIRAALERAGSTLAGLEQAELCELVAIAPDGVRFAHPLLRAACYHAAAPVARRAAHRALADALDGAGNHEACAWHLAAAALEPDEEVASALERVGLTARSRSGHSTAATTLARAADLTPRGPARAKRLVEAVRDAHLGGETERALRLIDQALDAEPLPQTRARAEHLRGQIDAWRAPTDEVHTRLMQEAERVASHDPHLAALMMGDAAVPHLRSGDVLAGLRTAERALEIARQAGIEHSRAEWVVGMGLVIAGRAPEAAPIIAHWTGVAEGSERPLEALGLFQTLPRALMWLEDYARARALARRLVESARETAPAVVPMAVATLAEIDLRTGDLAAALSGASEGVALARDTDQPQALGFCLAGLARVDAMTGRVEECRVHAAEAREVGIRLARGTPVATLGEPALGLLALATGDAEDAIDHLGRVARACQERGLLEPAMVQYGPILVEALVRAERRDEAVTALDRLASAAGRTGRTWALATAARCRGLLAPDDQIDAHFHEALRLHDLTPTPLERARTELCFGERLRRARRRAEARAHLRAALETFDRLGATPWAARAEAELEVSGATARKRTEPRSDALTPQELQVAMMVAGGATNREAGARLFLSAKTVEAHLGRIYRKVGVRSRTELAGIVAKGELAAVTGAITGRPAKGG